MGGEKMVLEAIRDFFERRRFHKDFRKMHALVKSFVNAVNDLARKDGYENALNPMEVMVLGTFLIAEIYRGFSRSKRFAADVLDEFHKSAAEWLFIRTLSSLQDKFPSRNRDALYDQFMTLYYEKVKNRYPEYRSVMLDENGLFKYSEHHIFEIGKHFLRPSSDIDAEVRKLLTFAIGLAVMDHISRCAKSLKH
ncbi:MAG: hypothetical protein HYU73_10175 [Betaproteobacteria bacterium]|nr:hypothetical protein [Betaproteobacteria bacterium]